MGQIEFVRAQIPWYLEHEAHISVEGDVPLELLDQDKLRAKRNDESILILSPADVSETTPRYFSKVEEGRFAVVIAPGMYRMGVIPRFGWPRYESNWLVTVSDNGFVSFEHYLARGGPGTFGMPISSGDAQYYDRVNAFQENTNTWVSSHAGNEVSHRAYLGMDFGSGHLPKLKEIRIQWAFDYCTPTAIAVQSSDQGQVWSTEAEYTVDVSDPARSFWWQTLELPHRKGRPLWRILALTPTKGEGGSMAVSQLQFLNA